MSPAEWQGQWRRLDQFRVSGEADRAEVSAEWFAQLKHHHVEVVDHGITQLIGQAKDTFLPGLGLLKDFIQQRLGRYDRVPGKCPTCAGSTWIDAGPWKSNGLIYEGLRRCPDCGVPEPTIDERRGVSRLTDLEMHEYRAGRYGRDQMPDGAGAKHPERLVNPEIKAAMAVLRKRLFGSADQVRESA